MPDVIPTIPQYPEQGIQAELDLVYLWNPNVANELIATLNELLEDLPDYHTVMVYKGSVATVADLPATAKIGDVYNVVETDENFCWTGTDWNNLGSSVDLTAYRTSADQDVIDQGLQDQINLKANAYSVYTKTEANELLAAKQDIINDLQAIRSGAAAGATAVQPGDLATVATSGSYTDLSNTPTLGTAAAENVTAFASAAQGTLADTAVQPADISDMETQTHAANTYATQTTVSGLAEDISDIEGLIPEQATTSNQLADKEFVNSSIATNTAYFIGTFRSVSALRAYSEPVTNNDYAFVTNDVVTDNGNDWATFADLDAYNKSLLTMFDYAWVINGTKFDLYRFEAISQTWVKRATAIDKESVTLNPVFNRYKATVSGGTTTWGYEYTLNNSSFTADQWTAINSGITPGGVTLIGTALQPGGNVSDLVNDAGYLTTHQSLADLGITATATELNVLDGITADTTELNYVDGVTDNIQTQLNAKQATLVSGTNIKTVNGTSLLGSGDITVSSLPSQTGQSGKFLTTDGTDASWSDKPLVNSATGNVNALAIKGTASGINSVSIGQNSSTYANQTAVAVGSNSKVFNISGVSIGGGSEVRGDMGTALGVNTQIQGNYSLAIGLDAAVTATNAIQISAHNYNGGRNVVNPDANTVKIANANGNFEIMSADGTIPEARLADTTNAVQGDVLTLDSNGNAVWQAGGGGSSYTAGTGINITNDVISTDNRVFRNTTFDDGLTTSVGIVGTSNYVYQTIIGYNCAAQGNNKSYVTVIGQLSSAASQGVSIGNQLKSSGQGTILIGNGLGNTLSADYAIGIGNIRRANMLSYGTVYIGRALYEGTSLTAGTFYIGLRNSNNEDGTVYEMLSHDGTIPEARLADTTNATAGQVLTLDSNLNAVWATPSGGGASSATATLAVNDWSSNTQTVNVTGVTASNNVIVAAAPASQADYTSAGILCTTQGAGTLTFTCTTVPSSAITVNILII